MSLATSSSSGSLLSHLCLSVRERNHGKENRKCCFVSIHGTRPYHTFLSLSQTYRAKRLQHNLHKHSFQYQETSSFHPTKLLYKISGNTLQGFNPTDHGLPPEAQNSDSLPYPLIALLIESTPCLEKPFRKLLLNLISEQEGQKPICIISDFFFGWTSRVAHEFGIFNAVFSATGAFGMACYYSLWLNLPNKQQMENSEFLPSDFPEAGKLHVTQLCKGLVIADDAYKRFQWENLSSWSNADALLLNTVKELDQTGLLYFPRKLRIRVFAIGPILLPENHRAKEGSGREAKQCIEWLDKKEKNSVLYMSFGSQSTISTTQMMQLAKALDASGRNFIWVVRPPLGFDINVDFVAEDWLPDGFVECVQEQDRGLVVEKWAPQLEILKHESVGAFISHCGWNSVLESLKNGMPMISWPLAAEQFYNAKFLVEELGTCLEVARGADFEIRHEDIMEKIELVMGENEEAMRIRRRACEVRKVVEDAVRDDECYKGSSVKAMEDLLNAALLMEKTNLE